MRRRMRRDIRCGIRPPCSRNVAVRLCGIRAGSGPSASLRADTGSKLLDQLVRILRVETGFEWFFRGFFRLSFSRRVSGSSSTSGLNLGFSFGQRLFGNLDRLE